MKKKLVTINGNQYLVVMFKGMKYWCKYCALIGHCNFDCTLYQYESHFWVPKIFILAK